MQTMTMNKRVTLRQVRTGQGHARDDEVISELTVFAGVREASLTFRMNAASAGMSADIVLHLWRNEFEKADFNRVVIDGVQYRIESVGAGINSQFVRIAAGRR